MGFIGKISFGNIDAFLHICINTCVKLVWMGSVNARVHAGIHTCFLLPHLLLFFLHCFYLMPLPLLLHNYWPRVQRLPVCVTISCLCIIRTQYPDPVRGLSAPTHIHPQANFSSTLDSGFWGRSTGRFYGPLIVHPSGIPSHGLTHRHFHCKGWTLKRAMDECKVNG